MAITKIEELSFDDVYFSKPIKGNGYYYMTLTQNKENPESIYMQTPKIVLSSNLDKSNFVNVQMTNQEYKNNIQHIDDTLLNMLKENKDTWFSGKGLTTEFIDTGYLPSLKRNNDWRMNVSIDNLTIYDDNKNSVDISDLNIGDSIRCIVQLSGLWFTNTRWGVSWKLIQIKKYFKKNMKNEYMFPDDVDYDTADLIEPPPGLDE